MWGRTLGRTVGVLALLSSAVAAPALAQSAPAGLSEETQAVLRDALAEYDRGNYAEAYSLFTRVHETNPTARTERALGNTAFELRRYVEAITWLEIALMDERNPLTEEMRTAAETVLARARAFVGRFTVSANIEGATVEVDGEPLTTHTFLLDVGDHAIVVSAVGHLTLTRRIVVHGGEAEDLTFVLHPTTDAATIEGLGPTATHEGRSEATSPPAENIAESWWLWTIVGVVAVGAGVGIGVGVAVGSGTALEAPLVPPGGLVMALVGP